MIKGIYTAASAMLVNKERMQTVSNNLSNVNTSGFKKKETLQNSFSELLLSRIDQPTKDVVGSVGGGVENYGEYTNHTSGDIKHSGNPFDLAINGNGFFALNTPGGVRYSRNGNFVLNNNNQLVDNHGNFVLGENGPIQLNPEEKITISDNGEVFQGDTQIDTIQLVDFDDYTNLNLIGNNLFEAEGEQPQGSEAELKQGYLENSNVNVVKEMVKMIEVTRAYETNQKVIQTMDSTLDKSVNEVGRLG